MVVTAVVGPRIAQTYTTHRSPRLWLDLVFWRRLFAWLFRMAFWRQQPLLEFDARRTLRNGAIGGIFGPLVAAVSELASTTKRLK